MSEKSDLKKEGIEIISKLDTLTTNSIAKKIASKICATFPSIGFNSSSLFMRLAKLNMYRANIPEGMSEANYYYKNTSMYFSSNLSMAKIEKHAIHEAIHYIQELKGKKNNLLKMGLCDFSRFKAHGLGINEAAVQYVTAKINEEKTDIVKYYDVHLITSSPNFYPLECSLLSQMIYITGEEPLIESVFNSTDNFKNEFIYKTSEKAYYDIVHSFDLLLSLEEKVILLTDEFQYADNNTRLDKLISKIEEARKKVANQYLNTQNLIIAHYFDSEFIRCETTDELDEFREKLYKFRDLLGYTDNYRFFDDYYIDKLYEFDKKYSRIENSFFNSSTSLILQKTSKGLSLLKIIRNLLLGRELDQN